MRKMTIAQLREKELEKLATITGDHEKARNLMNRYYRLAGLDWYLVHADNDEKLCNTPYVAQKHEKWQRMYKRLNDDFMQYGLTLAYSGIMPRIVKHEPDKPGCIGADIINTYFYQWR